MVEYQRVCNVDPDALPTVGFNETLVYNTSSTSATAGATGTVGTATVTETSTISTSTSLSISADGTCGSDVSASPPQGVPEMRASR
jgi:hypothetical protein